MTLHHESGPECPLCEEKLAQAHPYLRDWFKGVKLRYVNTHVSWAFRGEEEQNRALIDGKSKLGWPNSAHNKMEDGKPRAEALDLFQIDEDGVARFSQPFYCQLNKENVAARLPIFWGGRWNHLGDSDHWEFQPPKDPSKAS